MGGKIKKMSTSLGRLFKHPMPNGKKQKQTPSIHRCCFGGNRFARRVPGKGGTRFTTHLATFSKAWFTLGRPPARCLQRGEDGAQKVAHLQQTNTPEFRSRDTNLFLQHRDPKATTSTPTTSVGPRGPRLPGRWCPCSSARSDRSSKTILEDVLPRIHSSRASTVLCAF